MYMHTHAHMRAGSTGTRNDHAVPSSHARLRWGLRDTMVRAYVAVLDGQPEPARADPALAPVAHALLRLAIMTTCDVLA